MNTRSLLPVIQWIEGGEGRSAVWRSEAGVSPPQRVYVADDTATADAAFRLACEGTALLWRGDFQNARQLLQAMARRFDRKPRRRRNPGALSHSPSEAFHQQRMAQAQRARTLGMLLIPVEKDHHILQRRAPDVQQAVSYTHLDVYKRQKDEYTVKQHITHIGKIKRGCVGKHIGIIQHTVIKNSREFEPDHERAGNKTH